MFWQIQSDFEAFICCRLLFWRLRALAAGLTGARQKQLVQFWLPGRLWAPISSWICKNIAARISLEAGHSPASSQCGRLQPRGLNVKASTQTQPRYWPVGGWVAQEKIVRFQVGLLLENLENRLSNIGIILESFIISLGEKRSLEDHWHISHLTIQVCILMVVYWNIMFYR